MKSLIIVDVQRKFGVCPIFGEVLFGKKYVRQLKKYISNNIFDKIFYVLDNDTTKVTVTIPIGLNNFRYKMNFECYYKNFSTPFKIYTLNNDVNFRKDDTDIYRDSHNNLYLKTSTHHNFQELSPSLLLMVEELKCYDSIEIVGGARNECIQDIIDVLSFYKIKCKPKINLIYPIRNDTPLDSSQYVTFIKDYIGE